MYNKGKKILIDIVKWVLAALVAIIILNIVCFVYHRPVGWIERTNSSTNWIWDPGKLVVWGKEGYGIHRVDNRGYVNEDKPLINNGYILIMGASHSQGLHVRQGERYSDLLNSMLGYDNELGVYNVAQDGQTLDQMITNFAALTKEFPDSKAVVIEIYRTDYSKFKFDFDEGGLIQTSFDYKNVGQNVRNRLSNSKKASIAIKEYLPVINLIKEQMIDKIDMDCRKNDELAESEPSCTYEQLNKAFNTLREEYSGNIVVIYHPYTNIREDGSVSLDEDEYKAEFIACCNSNGIDFIDASERTLELMENGTAIYGFANTQLGKGHLNKNGHKLLAEMLSDYFGEYND